MGSGPAAVYTDKLTTAELAVGVMLILMLAGLGTYVYRLSAENERLRTERQIAEQRSDALADSLRTIDSYTDTSGVERTIFGKLNLPTLQPDTLGSDRVEGDTEQRTDTRLDPQADSSAATEAPTDTTDETWTYRVDDQIGRYHLTGPIRVSVSTRQLDYDFRIDGSPIDLTIYQAQREGQMQTVVDAPTSVMVAGLQGYSKPDLSKEFDRWVLEAPAFSFRPSLGNGLSIGVFLRRRAELPLGAVGYAEIGVLGAPTTTMTEITPTARAGIQWTF